MARSTEEYITYSVIAKRCGMSVNQLKMILAKKGYLRRHEPTEKALRSRLAVMKAADTQHPYYSPRRSAYPVWNKTRIMRMLRRSGHIQDPRFRSHSYQDAAKNLCEAGFELARHFGYEGETCEYAMASHLSGTVGPAAYTLAIEMTHGACWAKSLMFSCYHPNDTCKGLDQVVERARNHDLPSSKHLTNAQSILLGIEEFLLRQ